MLYKHNKVREMLRSILPSTARKGAREDRAASHRAHRSRVRQACRKWRDELLYDDDEWGSYEDADDSDLVNDIGAADKRRSREIRYMVYERRAADKINHFVRWAEHLTADTDDVREKYYRFVGHIGGSSDLIREHAVGHFINPQYDFRDPEYYSWRSYRYGGDVIEIVTRDQFRDALLDVVKDRKFDIVNDVLRANLLRTRSCRSGDPCISTTEHSYRWSTHYILNDGRRIKQYRLKEEDRANIVKTIYNERKYTQTHHDSDVCQNIAQLTPSNVDGIIKMLFPGGKPAWGFKERSYKNRPRAKSISWDLWKILREEGIIEELIEE